MSVEPRAPTRTEAVGRRETRLICRRHRYVAASPGRVFGVLRRIGGRQGFYYANWLWRLRALLDRCVGGPGAARRHSFAPLVEGEAVGLWRVAVLRHERRLLLRGTMRMPGRALLGFDTEPEQSGTRLSLEAVLETGSVFGRIYWYALFPVHVVIFGGLVRAISLVAEREASAADKPEAFRSTRPNAKPMQRDRPSPCMSGCPNGANVRSWITTIAQREQLGLTDDEAYASAWRTITDGNPFPAVTGRICPHPCESECNRRDKDGSVAVHQLERFVGDWAIARGLQLSRIENHPQPESIAVVGSGPAGLSFAYQMARRGYSVTVYERQDHAGGMLRYGIPAYRLPHDVVDREVQRIFDLGVEFRPHTRIGRDLSVEELRDRHAAVFLGIGAAAGVPLGVPGERGPGVFAATDYLEQCHRGVAPRLGRQVVVVGGGDVAMDAARMARRAGAEVTIVYRRSRAEMPAEAGEIEEAILEGVRIEYLAVPTEILRDGDSPSSVTLCRTRLGDVDDSGRRGAIVVPGSEFTIGAGTVIVATSRGADWDGIEVPLGARGRPRVEANGRIDTATWTGGDVLDPGIAIAAIAHGRRAAEALHGRLRGNREEREIPTVGPIRVGPVRPEDYPVQPRSRPAVRDPETWLSEPSTEIRLGLTEEQFRQELQRCLSCGNCSGCERCWMYCAHDCFSRLAEPRPGAYFALDVEQCCNCGKCLDLCPCGYLTDGSADAPLGG